ncbi:MAG: hypothetical protein CMJ18_03810 [Phycisphaeraceae bacterium]|nr:hypothetical protein [Phycisphaeraceae bacterium]
MNRIAWIAVLAAVPVAAVDADELLLEDGSRLIGEVTSMEGGKVHLSTKYAGSIAVDASMIKGMTTDKPMNVQLEGAEQAETAPLRYDEQGGQRVGDTAVDTKQVDVMWAPGTPSPKDPKWTGRAQIGLDGSTGNTEKFSLFGRTELRRDAEKNRMHWYLQARLSEENGDRSANEIIGGYNLEVDIDDRWFGWGSLVLEHDEFESLSLRATGTGGIGYFWIREPDHELKTRAGLGYEHARFFGGDLEDDIVASFGVDYRKKIAPWLIFTHTTNYYPALDDPGSDFRTVSDTAGEFPLAAKDWSVRVGMQNKFDNTPASGRERLDTFYYLSLIWDWK